jgi:Protein of unknown function (DUF3015)
MKKILAIIAVSSVSAFAVNPWVECGIGGAISTIFPNKKAANIIAVASNIVWDLGTTATSSAVSSPDLCMNSSTAAAKLIQDTYETLVAETAKGEGENLTALLDIIGVSTADRAAFIQGLRAEMGQDMKALGFSSKTQVEKAQSYYYGMARVIEKQS